MIFGALGGVIAKALPSLASTFLPGLFQTRAIAPYQPPPSALAPFAPGGYGMTRNEALRRLAARRAYTGPTYQQNIEALVDGGMGFRPRRRMNVLNPRALRRSIARVKGFSKFAQRVGSYTQPGKRYRLKGFAHRRRSR